MYTTRNPAHQNQSAQIGSAGWDGLHEAPFAVGLSPEEFFDSRVSLATVCPETALMYAVLEDAFICFQKQFQAVSWRVRRNGQEAEKWFFSDDSRDLFSFVSVCTALGLEPECIRKRLRQRRHADLAPRRSGATPILTSR